MVTLVIKTWSTELAPQNKWIVDRSKKGRENMALQLWRAEEIENVVWGTQTVVSAILVTSKKRDQPDYQQGFHEGFLAATHQVRLAFDERFQETRLEFQRHIVDTLMTIQGAITPNDMGRTRQQTLMFGSGFNHGSETALMCLATFFGVTLFVPIHQLSLSTSSPLSGHWFREDKDHILTAFQRVTLTTINASRDQVHLSNYQMGFEDALRTIAKSLGIRLLSPGSAPRNSQTAWLRRDIELNLTTINQIRKSAQSPLLNGGPPLDYQLGFEMTLSGVAHAFGITLK